MDQYYVYIHTNITNNKKYIGITKQQPCHRWGANGVNYKNSNPYFWNAIQLYGWDGFTHDIIMSGLTKEKACEIEIELIKCYQTQNKEFGYNIMSGGIAPLMPEEVRNKLSISLKGNQNGKGKPCSDEKKRKISEAQKGREFSQEQRRKMSLAKKGKSHKSPSEETRKKISDSHKKREVICIETQTVYPSIQQCARDLNLYATLICKCCKGKLKSTGGFHFQYYDVIKA